MHFLTVEFLLFRKKPVSGKTLNFWEGPWQEFRGYFFSTVKMAGCSVNGLVFSGFGSFTGSIPYGEEIGRPLFLGKDFRGCLNVRKVLGRREFPFQVGLNSWSAYPGEYLERRVIGRKLL